ncbi:hypothetical protein [Chelativorans sp.]|uniref:hypothetical protein n=1 Tax=Chelativorans sp. TaxID=2203393 RepID=UPI0028124A8B|nr:hypothetical protein [Chelativorans sp.]
MTQKKRLSRIKPVDFRKGVEGPAWVLAVAFDRNSIHRLQRQAGDDGSGNDVSSDVDLIASGRTVCRDLRDSGNRGEGKRGRKAGTIPGSHMLDQSMLVLVQENESGEPLSITLDPDAVRGLVCAIGQSFPGRTPCLTAGRPSSGGILPVDII